MTIKYVVAAVVTVLFSGVVLLACGGGPQEQNLPLPSDPKNYAPLEKYEAMKIPADNPMTAGEGDLGWQLWFDKRLSGDGSRSCYGCHVNEKGLTDGLVKNTNASTGKPLPRHTPTLWNIGYHDRVVLGRPRQDPRGPGARGLEARQHGRQGPRKDEIRDDIVATINEAATRRSSRRSSADRRRRRTWSRRSRRHAHHHQQDTAFDRWQKGDEKAVSDAAKRGWAASRRPSAPTATSASC